MSGLDLLQHVLEGPNGDPALVVAPVAGAPLLGLGDPELGLAAEGLPALGPGRGFVVVDVKVDVAELKDLDHRGIRLF